jgi:hypothetical protein
MLPPRSAQTFLFYSLPLNVAAEVSMNCDLTYSTAEFVAQDLKYNFKLVENLRWNKLGIVALQNKHGLCISNATDNICTLMVDAVDLSETTIYIYQTSKCLIPGDTVRPYIGASKDFPHLIILNEILVFRGE